MASTQATNKKGAPTQQAANSFAAQMKASRVAPISWQDYKVPNATQIMEAPGNNQGQREWNAFKAMNTTRYPQRPLPLDDRDSDVAILSDLAPEQPAGNNLRDPVLFSSARPYPVQDWEIQYMRDKAANEDYAAYRQWLGDKYDLTDMATRAWFKQIAPEYFTEKRELLKEMMDRHAKYSLLRMAGPENEEDLRFEYAVETGRIPIPKGPFYNPLEWTINEMGGEHPTDAVQFMNRVSELNAKAYQYGMFNPVKPRTAEQGAMPANRLNPQDIVGAPQSRSYGFPGQTVPTNYDWNTQYNGENLTGNRNAATEALIQANRTVSLVNGGIGARYNNAGRAQNPGDMYQARTQTYQPPPAGYRFPNKRLWDWGNRAPLAEADGE